MNKENKQNSDMTMETAMTPTPLAEIKKGSEPAVVALSNSHGDGEIYMAMKPLSVLALAAGGNIPNELLGIVTTLYNKGMTGEADLKKKYAAIREIARHAMVSPSLAELEAEGIQLTDRQLTEIYIFTLNGVRALKAFRQND